MSRPSPEGLRRELTSEIALACEACNIKVDDKTIFQMVELAITADHIERQRERTYTT